MTGRRLALVIGIAVAAVALGWALMSALSAVLGTRAPDGVAADTPAATSAGDPAAASTGPHIRVKLFFVTEDGLHLAATEQEVPLAEGVVAQARAIAQAQLGAQAPAPLVSAIPAGATLRGVYVSDRHEVFLDLDGTIGSGHPGGTLNELLTIYSLVNAITVNLPDVTGVQLLIDGREVDTLAGHVDLRQPLRKNESLIQQ